MRNNKRKLWTLAGALALALVMVLATTYAWFSSQDSVTNKLATGDALANVKIQETFVPNDDWKPGQSITKEVAIANTGDASALVRVSFAELMTVNQPPAGEASAFNATLEAAKKRPQLFDNSAYTAADGWFQVTTTANAAQGGVKLAADYSPAVVYAKYVAPAAGAGSIGSYSFAVWAPISGTSYAGKLQAVSYEQNWDATTKTLALSNIKYLTYQGTLTATADWTATPPAATATTQSLAETALNTDPAYAAANGHYPNNIELNYANITTTPTAGKWYYNAADGYFYYCGAVAGGTITPNLLASLTLNGNADSAYYANMDYELKVNSDALQNTKDALAAVWTTVAGNSALNTMLQSFCES